MFNLYNSSEIKKKPQEQTNRQRNKKIGHATFRQERAKANNVVINSKRRSLFFLDAEGLRRFRSRYGILNNNTTKQSCGFFDRVKHS